MTGRTNQVLQRELQQPSRTFTTAVTCLIYFFLAMTATGWGPVLLPLATRLSLPVDVVGQLYIAWAIGFLPGALIGGALLDRYGPRSVLFGAACISLVGMAAILLALVLHFAPLAGLIVCAGVAGVGGGTMEATATGLISALYARTRGVALNLFMTLYSLGSTLIFFVSAALLLRFPNDPRPPLLFSIAAMGIAALATLLLPRSLPETVHTPRTASAAQPPRAIVQMRAVLPLLMPVLIAILLATGLIDAVRAWMPTYLHLRYGQVAAFAAALTGLMNVTFVVCRLLTTPLIARIGTLHTLALGLLVTILGLLMLLWGPNVVIATGALVVIAIGLTPLTPTLVSIGSDRAARFPGTVSGLLFCAIGIGSITSSEVFGVLLVQAGPFWAVIFSLCSMCAGGAVVVWLYKERGAPSIDKAAASDALQR